MNDSNGSEHLFLGIDGGGTACKARLCNSNKNILGQARTGPANTTLGLVRCFDEIRHAAELALLDAGLDKHLISQLRVGAGLAGLSLKRERCRIQDYPHPFKSLNVHSDVHIAWLGAHGGADGGVVISGTGTCAFGLTQGRTSNFGGWGFAMADQGGAAALGRDALRRAVLGHDGLETPGALGAALIARFDGQIENLIIWAETATPGDYASFAPLVLEHGEQGDPAALELINQTARELTRLIDGLRARNVEPISLVGGLADAITPFLPDSYADHLKPCQGDALAGAIMLAKHDPLDQAR